MEFIAKTAMRAEKSRYFVRNIEEDIMYKILKAEKLNEIVYLMVVEAPMVAKHCQPGQFIIVKLDDAGERVPLTICDYDREAGTVTIVFQPIGASTEKFAKLQTGDAFEDFVGPLGCPSEFVNEDIEDTASAIDNIVESEKSKVKHNLNTVNRILKGE